MGHRSRLAVLVIDTEQRQREAAARFWSGVLGRTRRRADDSMARYAHLETPAGSTLDVIGQGTTPEHVGLHLGIEADDVEPEVARFERLGARRKRFVDDWCVMEAPSGHAFCVIPVQSNAWPEGTTEWPDEA
jgi:Glyoxalase-like domain